MNKIYCSLVWGEGGFPILPSKNHGDDAGWDLYVSRNITLPPNQFTDVHTDVTIAMEEGWYGLITGRSSTVRKRSLRVENGIIDAGYRGELFIGVWNLSHKAHEVKVGDRIAQILFMPVPKPTWHLVDALPPSFRGVAGFGSSGE